MAWFQRMQKKKRDTPTNQNIAFLLSKIYNCHAMYIHIAVYIKHLAYAHVYVYIRSHLEIALAQFEKP